MKRVIITSLLLVMASPSLTWAACFTVFDRANRIVYRDAVTPIDLSGRISSVLPARFKGGQLVISFDMTSCTRIDPRTPVNPFTGAAVL